MQKKQASKRVTVVTVIHNSEKVIGKCLSSIPEEIMVYVVDNASTDNGIQVAKKARPSVKIIKNKKNLGFGIANNIALEKVTTEFAFVLNPDTVMQQDTIDNLLTVADRYGDAAIIAPTLFYENGEIQKTYKNSVFSREATKSKYVRPEGDLCAECLSGAAMLLRVKYFKKTGFFDHNIFLFYEDDDICLKARKEGHSLVITPDAELVHLMGKSSPPTYLNIFRKNWHMMWSRLYLEKKYKGKQAAADLALKELVRQTGKSIGHLIMLNNEKVIKSVARSVAVVAFVLGAKAVREKSDE